MIIENIIKFKDISHEVSNGKILIFKYKNA